MAIKQFKDFDQVKAYGTAAEQLPRGGYVCKIVGAKTIENSFGQSVKIAFDVAEGEHAGYYQKKYDNDDREDKKWSGTHLLNVPNDDGSEQDGWTKRKFKTFTDVLEESNPNYHFDWDEQKFVGKMIGIVINYREWLQDGQSRWSPNAASFYTPDAIRKGDFKQAPDKALPQNKKPKQDDDGWMQVPEGTLEELQF
jgi:hypothetical protein